MAVGNTEIASAITSYCEDQGLGPGDRLPPERELANILGFTRAELRRGLARMEADRQIVRNVGRGTFIADDSNDLTGKFSPREVLEVRRLVEPTVMSLVVANATPADLERIKECLEQSERAKSHEEFEVWDGALHKAIINSTKNRLIMAMYDQITQARDQAVWGNLKRASFSPERRSVYEQHHRAIVAALVNRDADAAREMSATHIQQIAENMLGAGVG